MLEAGSVMVGIEAKNAGGPKRLMASILLYL
jgi:hypothetical protein